MNITKLKKEHEEKVRASATKSAIKVVSRICQLFPLIKEVQPEITGINTGMGTWSFIGNGIAISTEDECKGEKVIIRDIEIDDIIRFGGSDWYDFQINDALKEIVELLDFLVDTDEVNWSTCQDGFSEKGVVFLHSETSNQNNPFATPNKHYWMDSDYYKGLIKSKVPVEFVHEKTK